MIGFSVAGEKKRFFFRVLVKYDLNHLRLQKSKIWKILHSTSMVYGHSQAFRPSESDAGDHETPFDFNIIAYDWILGCGRKKTIFFFRVLVKHDLNHPRLQNFKVRKIPNSTLRVYGYSQGSRPSESGAGDHETPFDFNIIAYDWILCCGQKKTTCFFRVLVKYDLNHPRLQNSKFRKILHSTSRVYGHSEAFRP